jgi:hypothetical protein
VQKTFGESTTLKLESALMTMNGEEQDATDEFTMELLQTRLVTVTDAYERVADGRATRLARTFDVVEAQIEGEALQGGGDAELLASKGSGALAGHAVVFSWNPAEQRHVPAFGADDDGDPALLEGLEQDMDLVGFLPPADAQLGAEWPVPLDAVQRLLRPGGLGVVHFELPGEDSDAEALLFLSQLTARDACDALEGEAQARWARVVEVEGRTLAEIELELELVLTADIHETLLAMAETLGVERSNVEQFEESSVESAIVGEGVLLWDVAAGRMTSLELELEHELTLRLRGADDVAGRTMEMSIELRFAGTTDLQVETRVP